MEKHFFAGLGAAAFPSTMQDTAKPAIEAVSVFVDDSYRIDSTYAALIGDTVVQIPARLHFDRPPPAQLGLGEEEQLAADCLISRSTDGYLRQAALQRILDASQPWAIPFILVPAGEYVVEIAADLVASLPTLNRSVYTDFARANRPLLRRLQSRAVSYWNCYYRDYSSKSRYPALVFLREIESWAA